MDDSSAKTVIELTSRSSTTGQLMLAVPENELRDLLRSLFGRPQTITWSDPSPFKVDRENLAQFHHLLSQRIAEQHNATFSEFVATFLFDDGSGVTLNSFEDFLSYSETRNVSTESVVLQWALLIQFPGRPTPETQKVEITLRTPILPYSGKRSLFIDLGYLPRHSRVALSELKIDHTARTWAIDIQSIMERHLLSLQLPKNTLPFLIHRYRDVCAAGVAITTISIVTAFAYQVDVKRTNDRKARFNEVLGIQETNAKIDKFATLFRDGHSGVDGANFILAAFGMFSIGILFKLLVNQRTFFSVPSFIVWTKTDASRAKVDMEAVSARARNLCINFLAGVGVGIAGNFAYAWVTATP